jgi:hypothetical protein
MDASSVYRAQKPRHGRPMAGFLLSTLARSSAGKRGAENPAQGAEIPRRPSIFRITIFRRDGGGLTYRVSVNSFRLTRIQIGTATSIRPGFTREWDDLT